MNELFLTEAEVKTLTGRSWHGLQTKWLDSEGMKRGIRYYLNASGRPVVIRSSVEGLKQRKEDKPIKEYTPPGYMVGA